MIRAVIIDDEFHIRDTLVKMLGMNCPDVKVVGEASGVVSGIATIKELKPELVFLDLRMKDGTGFDLLSAFPSIDFKVIFVTAYDHYAVQAFRFSALDYLLKPVNPEQLVEAVTRAGKLIREDFKKQMNALEENLRSDSNKNKKVILRTAESIHLVDVGHIIFCDSDSCYTTVHTLEGEDIIVSKTLKDYEEMLTDCGFYRVHKSYLINLVHVKRFDRQDGGYIVLTNDLKIPVASRKRELMMELMEKMAE
ncbi:MAG: LytTR family DNA-binding domain-containing protein [Bacteroidales bacterium]|nr:LytTR family DNA-binding domain-containing protein [Bacteroidales bacterium]